MAGIFPPIVSFWTAPLIIYSNVTVPDDVPGIRMLQSPLVQVLHRSSYGHNVITAAQIIGMKYMYVCFPQPPAT